jgi:RND family efflux transporter MFP subunit
MMKQQPGMILRIATYVVILFSLLTLSTQVFADSTDAVAVTVAHVKHEQRIQPIRNSGRISHKNEMRLSFKTSGLIELINVEEGDEVSEGQILATLDLEEISAQQKRAASNYENAAADLQRFNKLHEDGLVSLQIRQNAQMANDSAAAELQIENFNKKLSVIRAPGNGRILKRFVESSELIQAGQPVFLLASSKQGSVVRVGLIDQDIVKVAVGDPVEIYLDAYPGRTFSGSVSEVALSTDSNAGTFEVEILINDQGFALRSGLIARVEITPASGDLQYFIPIESIFKADDGLARVFVLDEVTRMVSEVSVEIVGFLSDEVAVRGSLKSSDMVIKLGAPYLSDGSVVSVVDDS